MYVLTYFLDLDAKFLFGKGGAFQKDLQSPCLTATRHRYEANLSSLSPMMVTDQ